MDREELIEHAADLILNRSGRLPMEVKSLVPGLEFKGILSTKQWIDLTKILAPLATEVLIRIIEALEKRKIEK